MKINHATFTDALQIAMSIDGPSDWRERLSNLALPKGWSIAVSMESTLIFDVGYVDPWVTVGVHHELVRLRLRTPDMLCDRVVLQDLANSTWRTYERAIDPMLDKVVQESAWRQLAPFVEYVVKSRLHLQSEWAYIAAVVDKFNERRVLAEAK